MLSRFFRLFSLIGVSAVLFGLLPVVDVQASICCHCYRTTPRGDSTICLRLNGIERCDNWSDATGLASMRASTAGSRELRNFRCDGGVIVEAQCISGAGRRTDRCPSSPPPMTLAELEATFTRPAPPTGATNETNATNATNQTNAPPASGSSGSSGGTYTPRQGTLVTIIAISRIRYPDLPCKNDRGIVRIIVGIVGILFLFVFVWGAFST